MAFVLPNLPYPHNALEPYIDTRTMEIHHGKHHAAYTNNLNAAVVGTEFEGKSIEQILSMLTDASPAAVRNNGGGFYNHNLFWEIMAPSGKGGGGTPSGELAAAIDAAFGSFDGFKEKFAAAAASRFGSGWAWLCVHKGGKVEICSTPNQDNPLMNVGSKGCGGFPILGIDVWEHAYYLHYQNRRPDYVSAFYQVINWSKVAELYAANK